MLAATILAYSVAVSAEKGSEDLAKALTLAMEAKGFAIRDTSPDIKVFVKSAEALDLHYISLRYVLRSGDTARAQYSVSRSASGELKAVLEDAAAPALAMAEWGKPVGSVVFITNPPDAALHVNGTLQGRTPLTIRGFELGREYSVKAYRTGYLVYEGNLNAKSVATDTLRIKLTLIEAPPVVYREKTDFCGNFLMWGTSPGEGDFTSNCLGAVAAIVGFFLLLGCLL